MMPQVSVIIPTYNSAEYLPATIDSVLNQSFKDLEIIIVDDGSTDNTREVVSSIKSDKISYIYQDNSGGPSRPRNVGIKAAKGQYISIFDSDDIMVPDKIEQEVAFLESSPQLGLVFADCKHNFVKHGEVSENYKDRLKEGYERFWAMNKQDMGGNCYIINSEDAYHTFFYDNFISTSSVVIPRNVLEKTGGFDEDLKNADDCDMWFRITRNYDIGFINITSHYYRLRGGSITFRQGPSLAENKVKALRKQLETDLPLSVRKQAKKRIAKNLFGIGYHFQKNRNMKRGRHYYVLCLREHFCWCAIRGIIITLLPSMLFDALKKLIKSN